MCLCKQEVLAVFLLRFKTALTGETSDCFVDEDCVFIKSPAVRWKSNTCDSDGVCAALHPYIRDSRGRSGVSSLGWERLIRQPLPPHNPAGSECQQTGQPSLPSSLASFLPHPAIVNALNCLWLGGYIRLWLIMCECVCTRDTLSLNYHLMWKE